MSEEKTFSRMTSLIIYRKSLSKVVQSNPPVLHLSIEYNLEADFLSWLKAKLDFDDQGISASWLVKRLQQVLNFKNLEENLEPKLA